MRVGRGCVPAHIICSTISSPSSPRPHRAQSAKKRVVPSDRRAIAEGGVAELTLVPDAGDAAPAPSACIAFLFINR